MGGGENGEVGWLCGGELTFDTKDASRTSSEEFDHAHEREAAGVDELLEREREGGFEAEDAEGSFVELDVFEGGFVGGVIGGDGVNGTIGEAGNEGFAVFAGG